MMRKWDYNLHGSIEQDLTKRYVPIPIDAPKPPPKPLKAVILAAGVGNRLRPYTETTPKPLLPLDGHPILEYILDGLAASGITQMCLIVGYKEELIRSWITDTYLVSPPLRSFINRQPLQITFIHQSAINGTGGAVLLAKDWVGDSNCLVTYGDILMSWSVYDQIIGMFRINYLDYLLVGNVTKDPSAGAAIYYQDSKITQMIEKPPKTAPPTDLNNAGCYIFPPIIFDKLEKTPLSPRKEIELTWPIIEDIKLGKGPYLIKMSVEDFWCDVGTVQVYDHLQTHRDWIQKVINISEISHKSIPNQQTVPLSSGLSEIQTAVDTLVNQMGGYWPPLAMVAAITEELGEVAREVNSLEKIKPKKLSEKPGEITGELGDLLYALICLANHYHVDLTHAIYQVMEKYKARDRTRFQNLS